MHGTIDLIDCLRSNIDNPQHVVLADIHNRSPDVDERAAARTLELMIRIWLTISVRLECTTVTRVQPDASTIDWPLQVSLRDAVQSQFLLPSVDDWPAKSCGTQLDPSFTTSSLIDVCCVDLAWTNNLAEHLNFDKRRRILTVYEHKICLLNHVKATDSPVPHAVLYEAIDTLNLLFPFGHALTRELLRQEGRMALYRLGTCNRGRTLTLSEYKTWGPQLAELVELFNEPPRHWWQLLSDKRNLRDWATFWIGMLVLILTLVSIGFGTVSSVYTIKQYNLALAQACASGNAAEQIPGYCAER
jgi:hypothetical protein